MLELKKRDYDQPMPFLDPSWKGPMGVSRRKTDPNAFNLYLTFFILWLAIGVYVISYVILMNPKQQTIENDLGEIKSFNWTLLDNLTQPEVYRTFIPIFAHLPSEMFQIIIHNPTSFLTTLGCSALTIFLSVIMIPIICHGGEYIITAIFGFYCFCLILTMMVFVFLGGLFFIVDIVLAVVLTILITVFIKCHKEIILSCAIVKMSYKAVFFTYYHFLLPIVQFLLSFSALMFFANNIRLLVVVSKSLEESESVGLSILFIILHLGNFVGWVWTSNFIYGVEDLILAGSFSTWYWTLNKEQVPKNTVQYFASVVQKNHLGTAAVGSILMSIFDSINGFLGIVIQVFSHKPNPSCLLVCFSWCGQCLLYGIECISRDAYVTTALTGSDFYTSAKNTYYLMKRNIGKFIIAYVTFPFFVCVIMIAVIILMMLVYGLPGNLSVQEFYCLLITFVFIVMLTNSCFHLLQSAVDSVFLGVLCDYEMNSSGEQPFYMSEKLQKLMANL